MSRPILKVNVEISDVGTVPLIVHEGDDPDTIVAAFCASYRMDEPTIAALIDHVKSSIQMHVPEEARKHTLRYSRPTLSMISSRGRGGRLWGSGRKPPPSLTGSFLGSPPHAKSAESFHHRTPMSGPNGLLGAVMSKEQPPSVRHRIGTLSQSLPTITDKLFEDAAWIRERRELMRQRAEYLRSQQEMENVTFRPLVNTQTFDFTKPRTPLSGQSQNAERKLLDYQLKQLAKQHQEISECTFKPLVVRRSPPLPPGKVFDALYAEAQRRQDDARMLFGQTQVVTGRKFLSNKESEELVNRLTRRTSRSCPATPRMVGRAPDTPASVKSFSSSVAKGHALYAAAVERRMQKERLAVELGKAEMKNPEICRHSKTLMEEKKRRVFHQLFETLSDGADSLAPDTCAGRLGDIEDVRLRELVRPIVEYVSQQYETDFQITFDRFSAALEVRLSQAAAPTSSLFLSDLSNTATGTSYPSEQNFRPQLSARSNLRRDVNIPLYEALWRSNDEKEARLDKLREEKRQAETSECTFRPCIAKPGLPSTRHFSNN